MAFLYSIIANLSENERIWLSQRDCVFTGMPYSDRAVSSISLLPISYGMSGLPCESMDKHTGESMCPHDWQEKICCLGDLLILCYKRRDRNGPSACH